MTERERKPKVKFIKDSLNIEFDYQRIQTEVEEERLRDHYQEVFSRRAGRDIPRSEVGVSPKAGEAYGVTMHLQVKVGEPLYIGLWEVKQEAPEALPKLVDFLSEYQNNRRLSRPRSKLMEWTIDNLNKIIHPPVLQSAENEPYLDDMNH